VSSVKDAHSVIVPSIVVSFRTHNLLKLINLLINLIINSSAKLNFNTSLRLNASYHADIVNRVLTFGFYLGNNIGGTSNWKGGEY